MNIKIWSEEEINILKENYNKLTRKKVLKLLPRFSNETIRKKAKELSLDSHYNDTLWSEEEVRILKEFYGKIKKQDLIKLLPKRKVNDIHYQVKKYGLQANRSVTNRHTEVNHNFFADINPISCYYAGLIAADGNIKKNLYYTTLNQKDIKVIEKFKKIIGYSGKITKRQNSKKPDNYCHSISITSKKIVDDLYNNFNIIPKKSLILKPPTNLDYFHSLCFILGYIDGDGYISIINSKKQKPYIVLGAIGTKEICDWIKNILLFGKVSLRKDCKNKIYRYLCSCNQALDIIGKLRNIEELKDLRMNKKWNKILEINKCK